MTRRITHPLFHSATNGGTSLVSISLDRRDSDESVDRTIAALTGATISLHENNNAIVELIHDWARDSEGERSWIARYRLGDLKLTGGSDGEFRFGAWLLRAAWYAKSPFANAVEKDTTEDPAANYGYELMPPEPQTFPLPMRVEITYWAPTKAAERNEETN